MSWITEILDTLNDNTGVTLILSAIGFGANELLKTRNIRKNSNMKFKEENIDVKTLQKENELYLILTRFCLADDFPENNCIIFHDEIRHFIIDNDLFLREKLSKIGGEFANYIIEDVSNGNKDLQKQEDMLKEFKKMYRN